MPVRCRWISLLLAPLLVGCAGDSLPELHLLSGTITRNGELVTQGGLILLPDPPNGSNLIVNAAVRPDGTFTAQTEQTTREGKLTIQPGAPAGTYRVVYHPPSNGSKSGLEVELQDWITVSPGANNIALELPTELPEGRGEPRDEDETGAASEPTRDGVKPQ
jgi:hypothetical protein